MGFLDSIKDAVQGRRNQPSRDDYYDDGAYDGDGGAYYDDGYDEGSGDYYANRSEGRGTGLLGNPSRPEADSVSVYTRSGRPLTNDDLSPHAGDSWRQDAYHDDGAYRTADDSWRASADRTVDFEPVQDLEPEPVSEPQHAYVPPMTQPGVFGVVGNTPGDVGLTAHPRTGSGKLPPYVLKPTAYDDVQKVIRRVRTMQPVVLSFKSIKIETAKRILDFCFGLACGVDGTVEELGDRVFVVLPQGITLSDADIAKLRSDGLFR